MPLFSQTSLRILETCDERLQHLLHEAVKEYDLKVLEGHRGKEAQDRAFRNGFSKTPWPLSKHNANPSLAVDVAPYPVIWPDQVKDPKERTQAWYRFYYMGGVIMGIARVTGVKIRWGMDFSRDKNFTNDRFIDAPHFEIDET